MREDAGLQRNVEGAGVCEIVLKQGRCDLQRAGSLQCCR